jgi:hypothetical protein
MKILTVKMCELFGSFCANGDRAAEYRATEIEPFVDRAEEIVFDFSGVRNMNSSFCNSLIAPLAAHSADAVKKLTFCNLRPGLDVLIRSAIEIGVTSDHQAHA